MPDAIDDDITPADLSDLAAATFALPYQGRKRFHNAVEIMCRDRCETPWSVWNAQVHHGSDGKAQRRSVWPIHCD